MTWAMQMRKLPSFLVAIAIWFTQSVGSSTGARTPVYQVLVLQCPLTQSVAVLEDKELALHQVSVLVAQIQVKCQHPH